LPQICKSTVNDIAVVTTSKAVFAAINLGHLPPFDFNPQCHHHSLPWLPPVSQLPPLVNSNHFPDRLLEVSRDLPTSLYNWLLLRFSAGRVGFNMAPASNEEQFKFLISCIRYSNNGKVRASLFTPLQLPSLLTSTGGLRASCKGVQHCQQRCSVSLSSSAAEAGNSSCSNPGPASIFNSSPFSLFSLIPEIEADNPLQ
jgi:hypothetical protein